MLKALHTFSSNVRLGLLCGSAAIVLSACGGGAELGDGPQMLNENLPSTVSASAGTTAASVEQVQPGAQADVVGDVRYGTHAADAAAAQAQAQVQAQAAPAAPALAPAMAAMAATSGAEQPAAAAPTSGTDAGPPLPDAQPAAGDVGQQLPPPAA